MLCFSTISTKKTKFKRFQKKNGFSFEKMQTLFGVSAGVNFPRCFANLAKIANFLALAAAFLFS